MDCPPRLCSVKSSKGPLGWRVRTTGSQIGLQRSMYGIGMPATTHSPTAILRVYTARSPGGDEYHRSKGCSPSSGSNAQDCDGLFLAFGVWNTRGGLPKWNRKTRALGWSGGSIPTSRVDITDDLPVIVFACVLDLYNQAKGESAVMALMKAELRDANQW